MAHKRPNIARDGQDGTEVGLKLPKAVKERRDKPKTGLSQAKMGRIGVQHQGVLVACSDSAREAQVRLQKRAQDTLLPGWPGRLLSGLAGWLAWPAAAFVFQFFGKSIDALEY